MTEPTTHPRDIYNRAILEKATTQQVINVVTGKPDPELATQTGLAVTAMTIGATSATDSLIDRLRDLLVLGGHSDGLPEYVQSRARETQVLATGNDGLPSVQLTSGGEGPHYPQAGAHVWGEFAGLAVELGGYNDITAIDPATGRRLWVGRAFAKEAVADPTPTIYSALRKLVDAMETHRFFG